MCLYITHRATRFRKECAYISLASHSSRIYSFNGPRIWGMCWCMATAQSQTDTLIMMGNTAASHTTRRARVDVATPRFTEALLCCCVGGQMYTRCHV